MFSLRTQLGRALEIQAVKHNRLVRAWRVLGSPSSQAWTEYMCRWGQLHHIGEHCSILPSTVFSDPEYVSLGNNVHFSTCTVLGHDGSVAMLSRALGETFDSVGYVTIHDNVFIGYGAIIMPNVVIGPNAIVAAGSVVTRDVPEGTIVGGVPASVLADLAGHIERLRTKPHAFPWYNLIAPRRSAAVDIQLEPELRRQRAAYFFGTDGPASRA